MMPNYYRVCTSINDKGILVPEGSDFNKYTKGEAYISAFKYNEEQFKQFKKLGSVAGITDVKTDDLYFDLDCKENIEQAREDAIELVDRLVQHGIGKEKIKVAISGGKGYHVTLKLDKDYTPSQLKHIAVGIAGDLKSFDSVIYNSNRIIRMEGSVHPKTKLRKTVLSHEELRELSIPEIKTLAKEAYDFVKIDRTTLPESIMKLSEGIKDSSTDVSGALDIREGIDYFSNPLKLRPWKLGLYQGFYPDGQRSNALIILASTLMAKGMQKQQCYYALKASNDLQSARYGVKKFSKSEIWNNIIEQVYSPTWKGGQYSEDNFPVAIQQYFEDLGVPRETEEDKISDKYMPTKFSDIGDVFEDFVLNYEKNVIKTGIEPLDNDMPLTPGMNLGIIGAAGAGKTSIALKILQYCSEHNIPVMLASIDMNSTRLYEKILYRITGLSREELYQKFKDGEAETIKEQVRELFRSVYVYDKSACSIEDLRNYQKAIEKKENVKIKMVMVDYFERVNSDVSDDTASSKKIAGEWQDYINDFNIVGVMFVQPNKMGISGGPNKPILEYTKIKGSSFLYQSFRGIISLWRPFYTPETKLYDNYMQMALLKNDLGELNMYDFGWNGKRGDIYELDDDGKRRLKALLDEQNGEDEDEGY